MEYFIRHFQHRKISSNRNHIGSDMFLLCLSTFIQSCLSAKREKSRGINPSWRRDVNLSQHFNRSSLYLPLFLPLSRCRRLSLERSRFPKSSPSTISLRRWLAQKNSIRIDLGLMAGPCTTTTTARVGVHLPLLRWNVPPMIRLMRC